MERTQLDQGALLSGALLETAQTWQAQRATDLNAAETHYIAVSAAQLQQQQQAQEQLRKSQAFAQKAGSRYHRLGLAGAGHSDSGGLYRALYPALE